MESTLQPPLHEPSEVAPAGIPDVHDYLVLGIRPLEFRPAVIRRALRRSAATVLSMGPKNRDPVQERRLTRVLTIGYRLLDPRRREDAVQRMSLGRIHPQLADEAARAAQASGAPLSLFDAEDGFENEWLAGRSLTSQRPERARQTQRFSEIEIHTWDATLRSQDLLVERPLKRWLRSTRTWVTQHYVAAGAAISVVLLGVSGWRMSRELRPGAQAVLDQSLAAKLKLNQSPDSLADAKQKDDSAAGSPAAFDVAMRPSVKPTADESPRETAVRLDAGVGSRPSPHSLASSFVRHLQLAEAKDGVELKLPPTSGQ